MSIPVQGRGEDTRNRWTPGMFGGMFRDKVL